MNGTVFLVGTPIGNLDDVTLRAAEVLGAVEVCYAEDTRRTGRLLAHLGVRTPLRSLHGHNEAARIEEILERLEQGASIALVTDAGTPTVSDPGRRLVAAVHEAGHRVSPVPGASAVVAAVSVSGLPADRFAFAGFAPRRGASRGAWIDALRASPDTVVAFEAPGRLSELLDDLVAGGLAARRAVICRELTKLHEEVRAGTVEDLATVYSGSTVKGEVTVVIAGSEGEAGPDLAIARARARDLSTQGVSRRDIAERLAVELGLSRNEAYRLSLSAEESASHE